MARRTITIEEKIERQKQVVSKYKARYEAELETLDKLMQIRDNQLDKDLLTVFHKSGLSHQDVISFMTQKQRSDSEEDDES